MAARVLRFSKKTLVKVVVFIAISAVFTVGLAMKIGNLHPFQHDYGLQAVFADASGVFKGDDVKLAGVDVGRVSGAEIQNGKAVVKFQVQSSVKLPKDSIVAIRWRNVLGQRFLYVYPGRDQTLLESGDTVPLSQTEDAADLNEFLNKLGPILKAIDPRKANEFLDSVNTALAGNEAAVRLLLDDGAVLAGRLGGMDKQISTLISSSNTVISTYASQDRSIAQILDDLSSLGGTLKGMTNDVNSVLVNFADVQSQLNKLLTNSRSNIDASITELGIVASLLARDKGNLAQTLCTLPAGLAGYFQTSSWGEWFNVRVVRISLKDQSSQTVAGADELGSRPPAPAPYTHCAAPSGSATTHSGNGTTTGSPKAGTKGPAPQTPPPGFTDLGPFIQWVLSGGSDA
jgi:virulence factor Mce-like protein